MGIPNLHRLTRLEWRDMTEADYMGFAGAESGSRIAEDVQTETIYIVSPTGELVAIDTENLTEWHYNVDLSDAKQAS